MITTDLKDLLLNGINNGFLLKLKFIIDYFTFIPNKEYEDQYIKIKDGCFYGKLEDELILITKDYQEQIFKFNNEILLTNGDMKIVNKDIKTIVGRVITNWLLSEYCLNGKIGFIDEEYDLGNMEDLILPLFDSEDKDAITIEEYKKFLDMRLYIDTLAIFMSVGVTSHSIKPAPGIAEFVKKTIVELEKKYSEKPLKTPAVIAELESKVIEFDVAYLKQDISYGKLIGKKVIKTSRKRMYSVYGIGNDVTGKKTPMLIALINGIGTDPDTLTALFNDLRGGVAARGNETKYAGITTKELQKSVAGLDVIDTDCKSKLGIDVTVTKDNARLYIGKTIIDAKSTIITVDNFESYIGKTITLRDEFRCQLESGVCLVCIGRRFKKYSKTISLMATDLGGLLLTKKLSKFHGVTLTMTDISLDNLN